MPVLPELLMDLRLVDSGIGMGAFVLTSAVAAQGYLELHPWGRSYTKMLFGAGVVGLVSGFLVQLSHPVGRDRDEWVWVTGGAMPSAYFVTDRAHKPSDALCVFSELVHAWVDNVGEGGDPSSVFPFGCLRDSSTAAQMASHVASLDARMGFGSADRAQAEGWVDAQVCPRSLGNLSACEAVVERADMRGRLVVDNRGRIGIAIKQARRPSQGWLHMQRDEVVANAPPECVWWSVACLVGGFINSPEFLLSAKGRPAQDLVAIAVRNNEHTRQLILEAVAAFE